MSEENISQRIEGLKKRILNKEPRKESKIKKFLKKSAIVSIPLIALGSLGGWILAKDFVTKRQDYPERNVLFRSSNSLDLSDKHNERRTEDIDQKYVTTFQEGGSVTKYGTFYFETSRELRGKIEYFNMNNSEHIRIASATKNSEIVQPGTRWGGSLNFREEIAEIIIDHTKDPIKYTVYKFIPERGHNEKEITVIGGGDRPRHLENRLIDARAFGLGWLYGKDFRAGTFLEDYGVTEQKDTERFLAKIKQLDDVETENMGKREKVILETLEIEEEIPKRTIYMSYEDGIFDLLPQESTIYLAHSPSNWERLKHFLGFGRHDNHRLRVENSWDLWPGNYPILNRINWGLKENVIRPFGKYNNGGYTLEDKFGEVARIDMKDFFLFYGQDALYSYYMDLNGNGKIEEKDELIGQVLQRITREEKDSEDKASRGDVTLTTNYSFMSPTSDRARGMELFNLCSYVESLFPDQVHRGFGKHSMLGLIKEQRSDIMLYKNMTIENMSRALTQESSLVAEKDIVNVLIATRRPYAKEIAEAYGIAEDFAGRFNYEASPDLKERIEIGPIPGILTFTCLILGGRYYLKRRKNESLPIL